MDLYTRKQFESFTPEQQHSHSVVRLRNILSTIDRRLQRGDFLGAYSSMSNCMEYIAETYSLNPGMKPVEGSRQQAIELFSQGQYAEAYAVLKHLKQQLKLEGYKYQN